MTIYANNKINFSHVDGEKTEMCGQVAQYGGWGEGLGVVSHKTVHLHPQRPTHVCMEDKV